MTPDKKPPPRNRATAEGNYPEGEELILKNRALDASAEGITIADARLPDQPLIYVNKGFERLTGYAAEQVLGSNCRFLQGDDTDPDTVSVIRRAIKKGKECVVELLNYRKDGRPFWNRLSITPIRDRSGEISHFVGIQSDVSARRNAEEGLRRANLQLQEANRRITRDLEMAARIQQSFLPNKKISLDGVNVAWELESCDELAGDTLSVVPLGERWVEFYIIDVSGHGLPAALLSVTLNHLLSPFADRQILANRMPESRIDAGIMSPAEIAGALNKQFPYDPERGQYFTMVYGLYDPKQRLFRFVSAGHPPLIFVPRLGKAKMDWTEGLPIGVGPDFQYEENEIQMETGDRVYLYSDGLIEVFDQQQQLFGLDRLEQTLMDHRAQPLTTSVQSVIQAVGRWGQQAPFEDDVSILAFEAR